MLNKTPSRTDYDAACDKLVSNVFDHPSTRTAKRSARVLLSLYHGGSYTVDLQDITLSFDRGNKRALSILLAGFPSYGVGSLETGDLLEQLEREAK